MSNAESKATVLLGAFQAFISQPHNIQTNTMANNHSTQTTNDPFTDSHPAGPEARALIIETNQVPREPCSPLLKLPAELRNKIYELALSVKGRITITKSHGFLEPPLLLTNKQMRKEAIGLFYTTHEFDLVIASWDPSLYILAARKSKTLRRSYRVDLKASQFRTVRKGSNASWKNLKRWLHLRYDGVERMAFHMPTPNTYTASSTAQGKTALGLVHAVDRMKASPWGEVERVLELLRAGLVAIDAAWGLDQ